MTNKNDKINMNGIKLKRFYGLIAMLLLLIFVGYSTRANASENVETITIKGVVRDAKTKLPVAAARIAVQNQRVSATTDENGEFTLQSLSPTALLSVTAFEYNVREFPVRGKNYVTIDLYPDAFSNYYHSIEGLNGLITNTLTTSSVKGMSNLSQSTALSPDDVLQTELAGDVRSLSRSGAAAMGSSLFVRGLNSVSVNAQPLFVVDGVIWDNLYDVNSIHAGFFSNPLANIEMSDVESITLLKDGTSIYGAKAANGVVLIKTKRGSSLATKINLNVITGFSSQPKTLPVMEADAYRVYATELLGSAGLTNNEIAQLPYLNNDPARSTYAIYHNNTNWANEVYQQGMTNSYAINVDGGDEKALYYFALGYTKNDGVVKNNDFQRYNMRLNADLKLTDAMKMGINIGFSRIDRNLIDDGVQNYSSPTWISRIKSPFLSPNTFTFSGEKTSEYAFADIFNVGNPGAIIDFSINTLKQNAFNVSLKPEVKLSPLFTLTEQFDYNVNKTNEDYYKPYLFSAPEFIPGVGDSYNMRLSQVMRNSSLFSDTRLNFAMQLDALSRVTAFAGTRFRYRYFEADYVEGHNSKSNSSINLLGGFTNLRTDGVNDITKNLSHYLNADYVYDNRLMLNLAMALDASSRFGKDAEGGVQLFGQKWGFFPSINAAWLASSEKFMQSLSSISLLKFRVGYGLTGNDDLEDFITSTYFSAVRLKGVANGIVLSNLANPSIRWETTGRANAGVDIALFNERIFASVDVYSSVTDHLLVMKDFQDVVGLGKYWTNAGSLSNKGIELSANAKLVNGKHFQWELGASAGHYVNQMLSLPNGEFVTSVPGGEVLTRVGESAGVFYGYKTSGVFATEDAATNANLKMLNEYGGYTYFAAGDVIFEDISGPDGTKDGIIDEHDKQVIGNPNPLLYGSITNKFSYRKLSLSALFTYSLGNDVYNYQRRMLESGHDFSNQSVAMQQRWTSEGQETTQPRAVFGDPMGNARFSDRWIENGSYLRLKALTLSYDLPIKTSFISGLNCWISAENLFTITNYLGSDPEMSYRNSVLMQGVDMGLLPLSRNYMLGIKLNL